jgi:hypothetical protein
MSDFNSSTDTPSQPRRKMGGGALAAIIIAVVVVVLGGGWFLVSNSVTNAGNVKETQLNAQYLDNQNWLSDCLVKTNQAASITKAQTDAFDKAMTDVIKGRYDGRSAQPGSMFSAIVENYPDMKGFNDAFNRAFNTVMGCRTDYRGMQSKLLDMLQKYDAWRTGSFTVRTFGGDYPSNNLVAQIGSDRSRKGQAALDQMYTIVTTKDTQDAYKNGTMPTQDPFGGSTPAATPTR